MNSPCPCCAGGDWEQRWAGFIVCRHCGLMTVPQHFDLATLKQLYGADYFQGREYVDYVGDRRVHERTLRRHLRQVLRRVPAGSRILEIGCAHGYFLELLRDVYPRPVGVDVSAAAVADAVARGCDARAGDLLEMQFADQFDAVCLWDTVEHLSQPREVLRRAVELLRPGGLVFLSTGDFGAWLPRWQGLKWRQIHPPTHLFYFTRPALRQLCHHLELAEIRFGTVTVYRRLGSALTALERTRGGSAAGRLAAAARRLIPKALLEAGIPLNLGDTLWLVARKPPG